MNPHDVVAVLRARAEKAWGLRPANDALTISDAFQRGRAEALDEAASLVESSQEARVEQALRWYADPDHWLDGQAGEWVVEEGNHVSGDGFAHNEFEHDNGERARAALEPTPTEPAPAVREEGARAAYLVPPKPGVPLPTEQAASTRVREDDKADHSRSVGVTDCADADIDAVSNLVVAHGNPDHIAAMDRLIARAVSAPPTLKGEDTDATALSYITHLEGALEAADELADEAIDVSTFRGPLPSLRDRAGAYRSARAALPTSKED